MTLYPEWVTRRDFIPAIADLSPENQEAARSARRVSAEQEEGPPPGRAQHVTAEDLEQTAHRIRTGLPALPMACWRWAVLLAALTTGSA